jgi:anti-anti-sigma factor
MSCEAVCDEGKLTIYLSGKCSYELWTEPKKLLMAGSYTINECEVDFSKASFIDSAGIGSLLALREMLGENVQIVLSHTNDIIHEVLKIAQVERMFKVD